MHMVSKTFIMLKKEWTKDISKTIILQVKSVLNGFQVKRGVNKNASAQT